MGYAKGQRVRHPKMDEWGVGEVLEDSRHGNVRIFFVGEGEKTLRLDHVKPVVVSGEEAESSLLDNLKLNPSKSPVKYTTLDESVEYFLSQFPRGFYGDKFHEQERDYKEKASKLAINLLAKAVIKKAIENDDTASVCQSAMKVMGATNLVFPNEKMALKDGLRDPGNQVRFSVSLHDLLYGEESLEKRFNSFCRCLESIGAAKWTVATYFPFLVHPDTNMFVKPTITQHAAELCRFEINYQPKLNWLTYKAVLDFSGTIKKGIAKKLEPRDMIDVQSFIWCIAPH